MRCTGGGEVAVQGSQARVRRCRSASRLLRRGLALCAVLAVVSAMFAGTRSAAEEAGPSDDSGASDDPATSDDSAASDVDVEPTLGPTSFDDGTTTAADPGPT